MFGETAKFYNSDNSNFKDAKYFYFSNHFERPVIIDNNNILKEIKFNIDDSTAHYKIYERELFDIIDLIYV